MSCAPCPGPIVIKVRPQGCGNGQFTIPPIRLCCTSDGCCTAECGEGNDCCPPRPSSRGGNDCCPPRPSSRGGNDCCRPRTAPNYGGGNDCCRPRTAPNYGGGNDCCRPSTPSNYGGGVDCCPPSSCCPPRGCPCPPATCEPCACPDPWPPCCPEKKKDNNCCVSPKISGCPPRAILEGTPDPVCCQPCCNPCPCCCPAPSAVNYLPNTYAPCCSNDDGGIGGNTRHREKRWPQCNFMKPCIDTRIYRDGEPLVISYAGHIPGEYAIFGRNLPTATTFAKRRLCTLTPYEFVDPDGCCSQN